MQIKPSPAFITEFEEETGTVWDWAVEQWDEFNARMYLAYLLQPTPFTTIGEGYITEAEYTYWKEQVLLGHVKDFWHWCHDPHKARTPTEIGKQFASQMPHTGSAFTARQSGAQYATPSQPYEFHHGITEEKVKRNVIMWGFLLEPPTQEMPIYHVGGGFQPVVWDASFDNGTIIVRGMRISGEKYYDSTLHNVYLVPRNVNEFEPYIDIGAEAGEFSISEIDLDIHINRYSPTANYPGVLWYGNFLRIDAIEMTIVKP